MIDILGLRGFLSILAKVTPLLDRGVLGADRCFPNTTLGFVGFVLLQFLHSSAFDAIAGG